MKGRERHWAINYLERSTGEPYPLEFVVRGELQRVSMAGMLTVTDSEAYVAGTRASFQA